MLAILSQLWNDESGQGLPEYALLVAAVVSMVLAAAVLFDDQVQQLFGRIGDALDTQPVTPGQTTGD